jgi:hypothetical protein
MSSMLGGNPQEDMFAKLESMREIITEVNTQFKDAVCVPSLRIGYERGKWETRR